MELGRTEITEILTLITPFKYGSKTSTSYKTKCLKNRVNGSAKDFLKIFWFFLINYFKGIHKREKNLQFAVYRFGASNRVLLPLANIPTLSNILIQLLFRNIQILGFAEEFSYLSSVWCPGQNAYKGWIITA